MPTKKSPPTLEEMLTQPTEHKSMDDMWEEVKEDEKVDEVKVVGEGVDPSTALNLAADLLLDQLTPSIRDFAKELADIQLHIPRWQLVIGSLLAQYQSGTLAAPSIDPGWTSDRPIITRAPCEWCHKKFEPERIGQRFCGNVCGTAWYQTQRAREKEEKQQGRMRA